MLFRSQHRMSSCTLRSLGPAGSRAVIASKLGSASGSASDEARIEDDVRSPPETDETRPPAGRGYARGEAASEKKSCALGPIAPMLDELSDGTIFENNSAGRVTF